VTVSATAHERRPGPEARGCGAPSPGAVPAAATCFIGRARERVEIGELLLDEARLVTLVGAGGCGKTRLAREVATGIASRSGAVARWVELAGLDDPALVPGTVAAALDARSRSGVEPVDAIIEQLDDGSGLLLVLDNCEHLVGACADLVARLLRARPGLRVLATSREPLAVEGEVTYPVEPLPLPDPAASTAAAIAAAESVQLFELRARQARPDFELDDGRAAAVAAICRHLDGIPLALELAAVRVRVLTPRQIEEGLSDRFRLLTGGTRDAPTRQRTLEASLDWSYDLLEPSQRLALARLSVFAGGFDLEAAQGVIAFDGIDHSRVLDLLTALAERSLLQVDTEDGPARYRLLETIRLYAGQRLVELEDTDRVRERHLEFHVELAARARAGLAGPHARTWTARLAAALDDLRTAMDRGMTSQRPLVVLDVAEPTFRFWFDRGLYPEMRRRLHAAVDDPSTDDSDRARGSVTAALLAVSGGDSAEAHALADRAVARLRAVEDDGALGFALILRAWAGFASGFADDEALDTDTRLALALAEPLDDLATRVHVLIFAGQVTARSRSVPEGRQLLERAVALCEQDEVAFHLPAAHAYLGQWPVLCGDLERSCEHARTGIELSRELRRPGTEALARAGLAAAETFRGDEQAAREQVERAQALLTSRGLTRTLFDLGVHYWVAMVAYRFGDHQEARAAAGALYDLSIELHSRYTEAVAEWLLGVLSIRADQPDDARRHLERCRDLAAAPRVAFAAGRAALGLAHLQRDQGEHDQAWELAQEGLDLLAGSGDRLGAADALEAVAAVATRLGRGDRALRLFAAAEQFREQAGVGRLPLEADRFLVGLARARAELGANEAEGCWEEGAALSLEEAVAYARRGRGERGRPEAGWDALTPTERDLVRLVVEGHTNRQIGERLFVSPNTAKKHLSSVYAKVGAAGRAELVAEAVRRGL
jgi:predicted ATPase/DNA-binding CsgD family transcriptional regulator